MALSDAVALALDGLSAGMGAGGPASTPRPLGLDTLEVAVLERARPRRAFRRVVGPALGELLPARAQDQPEAAAEPAQEGLPED
jgi:proteasome alpha subunit